MSVLLDLPANARAGFTGRGPLTVRTILSTLATARYWSVFLYRVSQRLGPLGLSVKQLNQILTGADIAPSAQVGKGLVLFHPNGVVIGRDVVIGQHCVIQQGVTIGGLGGPRHEDTLQPTVGNGVFVGAGARLIGAIKVGDGVVIGANAVVTKDVPAGCNATGVPAKWRQRNE